METLKPNARPVVLFAGKFGGLLNVKYLFLEAAARDWGFQPLFLAESRAQFRLLHESALPVVSPDTCDERLFHDAALYVVEDFPHKTAFRGRPLPHERTLQLWHGVPLKKIGFPEIESGINMNPEKAAYLAANYSGYAAVPSTSPWVTENLFSRVFKANDFPVTGFPRNDVLSRPSRKTDMLEADQRLYARVARHKKQGGKAVIYMPTFRDTGGDFISDKVLDIAVLDEFCRRRNILFIAKFHPNLQTEGLSRENGFMVYPSQQDIYPLLPLTDALITDYSSIYIDYMLVDKPLIFFAYDKEKYLSKDRELFCRYEDATPGHHAATQTELLAALTEAAAGHDPKAAARRALRDTLFTHQDAGSSARLCAYIRDTLLPAL